METNNQFRIGILTLSDKGSRGEREDASGQVVKEMVAGLGEVVCAQILPDEFEPIVNCLQAWSDQEQLHLILTTGGTGVSPRDVTPQATLQILDYEIPGMAEAMRQRSLEITPHAMLSRSLAGVRGQTLIINLPGSPKSVRENLAVVLPALKHALLKIGGDPTECAIS